MQPVIQHRNQQIYIELSPLLESGLETTFLTADVAAAGVSLLVKDIDGFGINQILIIGELGEETCEIVKTHASTVPAGTTITLVAGGCEFAHSTGINIYQIQFNQIELSHSVTLGGSKSVLATLDLQVDGKVQVYTDVSQSSGFYFARFKDSVNTLYSSYSDGTGFGGWDKNQAGAMIDQALKDNEVNLSANLSRQDCYQFLTDGIDLVMGKQLHYPKHQQLNYVAGQSSRGNNVVALPADMYIKSTNQSLRALRIGDRTLTYTTPDKFAEYMKDAQVTQVRTQAVATDITLAVDNSYDFADSGTVSVYISGVKYEITYTGVTRSATAGVLTGIPGSGDGAIAVTIPVDTYVWQGETEGVPDVFTVRNEQVEYWPLVSAQYDNFNIEMDYWTVATAINSDGDVIDLDRYSMLLDYLRWRIRMKRKSGGALEFNDGWYLSFKERLNDAIRTSVPLVVSRNAPRINRMIRRGKSLYTLTKTVSTATPHPKLETACKLYSISLFVFVVGFNNKGLLKKSTGVQK